MNDIIKAIATRAVAIAIGAGIYMALAMHRIGESWDASITEGVMAFLLAVFGRGIVEGGLDVRRALQGKTNPGDVPSVIKRTRGE